MYTVTAAALVLLCSQSVSYVVINSYELLREYPDLKAKKKKKKRAGGCQSSVVKSFHRAA